MITKETKFEMIHNILTQPGNLIQLDDLCEIACVSRSGYYYWQKAITTREIKEAKDREDFELILEAFKHRGYDKGIRGIHMRLLHQSPHSYERKENTTLDAEIRATLSHKESKSIQTYGGFI